MNIFLDCEFTELSKEASLISLALYVDDETFFYAEFNDYDKNKLSDWHKENVTKHLEFEHEAEYYKEEERKIKIKNATVVITEHLKTWLKQFNEIEIWGDVPHYDWVLFCDLFGGALMIPQNVHYICRDIATLLLAKNINIDIERTEFVKNEIKGLKNRQHNALFDAIVGKFCYQKLIKK